MKLYLLLLLTLALPITQIQASAPGPKEYAAAAADAATTFAQPPRAIDDIPAVSRQVAQTIFNRDESVLTYHLTRSKDAKELKQVHEHFLLGRQAQYQEMDIQQQLEGVKQRGHPAQITDLEQIRAAHSRSALRNLELELIHSKTLKEEKAYTVFLFLQSQRNTLQSKFQLERITWAEEKQRMQSRLDEQAREIQILKAAVAQQKK